MDDQQLEQIINCVKQGELQQFNRIIECYQKPLYHYIYCIVNSTQDAEDIVQDTYLTALSKIRQYKSDTKFTAWLYRIARNFSYNHMKKHKRIILFDNTDIISILDDRSASQNYQSDLIHQMNQVFQHMTFQEKNIMVLRIYEEKSYEEIAYIMKISPSTCRKKYERARKKFIKLYNEANKEEQMYGYGKELKNVF